MVEEQKEYVVNPGWGLLMADAGINSSNVLRRAGLPRDLFKSGQRTITVERFFALWRAIETESGDPLLPLAIGQAISMESFDVPLFAATCSPNLNVAARRLARHKKLVGPMDLFNGSILMCMLAIRWPVRLVRNSFCSSRIGTPGRPRSRS